jgi:hypothetical protein
VTVRSVVTSQPGLAAQLIGLSTLPSQYHNRWQKAESAARLWHMLRAFPQTSPLPGTLPPGQMVALLGINWRSERLANNAGGNCANRQTKYTDERQPAIPNRPAVTSVERSAARSGRVKGGGATQTIALQAVRPGATRPPVQFDQRRVAPDPCASGAFEPSDPASSIRRQTKATLYSSLELVIVGGRTCPAPTVTVQSDENAVAGQVSEGASEVCSTISWAAHTPR